jgi:ATP-dependent DNA ligase
MLVSPAAELPTGEEWAFEVKRDGKRALVSVDPDVRVRSRHGRDHTGAFPKLATLGSLAGRAQVEATSSTSHPSRAASVVIEHGSLRV